MTVCSGDVADVMRIVQRMTRMNTSSKMAASRKSSCLTTLWYNVTLQLRQVASKGDVLDWVGKQNDGNEVVCIIRYSVGIRSVCVENGLQCPIVVHAMANRQVRMSF